MHVGEEPLEVDETPVLVNEKPARREMIPVITCVRTGGIINDRVLADAIGLDPERQAKMARLYVFLSGRS